MIADRACRPQHALDLDRMIRQFPSPAEESWTSVRQASVDQRQPCQETEGGGRVARNDQPPGCGRPSGRSGALQRPRLAPTHVSWALGSSASFRVWATTTSLSSQVTPSVSMVSPLTSVDAKLADLTTRSSQVQVLPPPPREPAARRSVRLILVLAPALGIVLSAVFVWCLAMGPVRSLPTTGTSSVSVPSSS